VRGADLEQPREEGDALVGQLEERGEKGRRGRREIEIEIERDRNGEEIEKTSKK
jgi:hypothetical protein